MASEEAMVLGVFRKVDDDGSGYLDVDEVRELAGKLGFTLRDDEFEQIRMELFFSGQAEVYNRSEIMSVDYSSIHIACC